LLALAALAALAAMVAASGCSVIEPFPALATSLPACGVPFIAPCASCAEAQCCEVAQACARDPACLALESCLAGCRGEPTCRSACALDAAAVDPAKTAPLDACLATRCGADCSLGCGGLAGFTDPDAATPCSACLASSPALCAAQTSCATSTDCQAYLRCNASCVTGDCIGACDERYAAGMDGGASQFEVFFSSLTTSACSGACDVGTDWACVGGFNWPKAQAPTLTLDITLQDLGAGGTPVGPVTVKLCDQFQCGAGVQTDSQLRATLTAQGYSSGQYTGTNGYLDLSTAPGSLPPDAGSRVHHTLVYWGFPLSEAHGAIAAKIPVLSEDTWQFYLSIPPIVEDASAGSIAALVVDCFGTAASGVVVRTDAPGAVTYYVMGALPSPIPTETDPGGKAQFFNVPPGSYTVTATPRALGRDSASVTVSVQAGALTEVGLGPTMPP
jgi:hypothetical protein